MNSYFRSWLTLLNPFSRFLVFLTVLFTALYLLNHNVSDQMTFKRLLFFVLPYLFYFSLLYWVYYLAIKSTKVLRCCILLIGAIALGTSYWVIKWYYYEALLQIDIRFFHDWKPSDEVILLRKIGRAIFIFCLVYCVDYFFVEKRIVDLRYNVLEKQLNNLKHSFFLSGHSITNIFDLIKENRLRSSKKVMDFLMYVEQMNRLKRIYVPLEEEWEQLLVFTSLSTDRTFLIEGEELVSEQVWNRSVPGLSLITWMDNALNYSVDKQIPIKIIWSRTETGLQLCIENRVSTHRPRKGSGNGLALVNALFETLIENGIQVHYAQEGDIYRVTVVFNS